jgi:hypothetical protein
MRSQAPVSSLRSSRLRFNTELSHGSARRTRPFDTDVVTNEKSSHLSNHNRIHRRRHSFLAPVQLQARYDRRGVHLIGIKHFCWLQDKTTARASGEATAAAASGQRIIGLASSSSIKEKKTAKKGEFRLLELLHL